MDPASLRLVTYNVKCFPWTAPPIRTMVTWLTKTADIVALQEVWCQQREWSAAFTAAGWTFLRPARENHMIGFFGSGLAVAWKTATWSLVSARLYPYISAVGFDSLVAKGWFRVELLNCETSAPLRLINTHMQSDYEFCDELWRPIAEPVRMAQALQLVEVECRMPPAPTLIVGDMNTEMCWFQGCEWMTNHCGPTFPGTSQVLDHCVTWKKGQQWKLLEHRVGRECGDWSDHWPVIWRIHWARH